MLKMNAAGFTLIELIVTIVIAGIVATMVSSIVGSQAYGYVELEKRSQLVQLANTAMQQITRDIRSAVPNSIRVTGDYLELVPIEYMAYYRKEVDHGAETIVSDALDFTIDDDKFDVYDDLVTADDFSSTRQVVIYNLGLTGANIYEDQIVGGTTSGVISEPGVLIQNRDNDYGDEEDRICFDKNNTTCVTPVGQQFLSPSPTQRVYIVDGALTYYCSPNAVPAAGILMRYSRYALEAVQPADVTAAPLTGADSVLVSDSISACSFEYSAGTMRRDSVVSIQLTLTDGDQSITLMKQVKVSNVP